MFIQSMFTLAVAAILTLPQIIDASPFSYHDDIFPLEGSELLPRAYEPEDCRLWATTNPWTTCAAFMAQYNIALPDLYAMNPSVEFDCYKWKSGTSYCLRMPSNYPITTDGQCGRQAPVNETCIGSTFGDCCGSSGRCGSTDAFCAIGNCQAGECPGLGYSTDGLCGPKHGSLMCGGSFGNCCSNAGKCGSTTAECAAANCAYGACVGASSTIEISSPPTALPSPFSPSPDGTCGYVNQYKCTDTKLYYGNCCGAAGYCGSSLYECNDQLGCQPEYGLCDETVIVTVTGVSSSSTSTSSSSTSKPVSSSTSKPVTSSSTSKPLTSSSTTKTTSSSLPTPTISPDGKCGSASSIGATCKGSSFGNCCSVKGNCGSSPTFCAATNQCQPLFGDCQPTSLDGKCGAASSTGATCIGSSFGSCCSVKGNCGSSPAFCAASNQCNPTFGNCQPTSTDGKCGAASSVGATCIGSSFGDCCSVKGNCGTSAAFCAAANQCQPTFGDCQPTSTDGKCGSASTVGASCIGASAGSCCSVKGNCGASDAFCLLSNLCQPVFGTCT